MIHPPSTVLPQEISQALRGRTFLFLAPGFLHDLCNALFQIQGTAQMAAAKANPALGEVLAGAHEAEQILDVLRLISVPLPEDARARAVQQLLPALCAILRLPLRMHGTLLEFLAPPQSAVASLMVDGPNLCVAVAEATAALVEHVPASRRSVVSVSLTSTDRTAAVHLQWRGDPGCLPFPVPLPTLSQEVAATVTSLARVELAKDGLTLQWQRHDPVG